MAYCICVFALALTYNGGQEDLTIEERLKSHTKLQTCIAYLGTSSMLVFILSGILLAIGFVVNFLITHNFGLMGFLKWIG